MLRLNHVLDAAAFNTSIITSIAGLILFLLSYQCMLACTMSSLSVDSASESLESHTETESVALKNSRPQREKIKPT